MMFAQESTLVGDVDCSGEVNSEDASLILQFVTNVIDSLPCEANMTGLTPEQLEEMINVMNEQLNINYSGDGASNYPIMISSISSEEMQYGDALIFCSDLVEDSYDDWFLPNLNQLVYSVSGGCELPDERTQNPLWTASQASSVYYLMSTLNESGDGGFNASYGAGPHYCRCVRFGDGTTSESSSGSSNSPGSGSSILGNSEQPITMIGPMYLADDFSEFKHFNTITTGSYIRDIALSWIDAKRFCGQLEYDGYNDWFLPSLNQIMNYYTENHFITISNINNFTSPWTSYYLFWTNSDTGSGASGQSPYYKSTLSIYLPNTTITIENGDVLDTSNRLLSVNSASLNGDYRACFCVR